MKLIVDTNVFIDYLRGGIKGKKFIDQIQDKNDIELFIPTIVIFELFSGKSTKDSQIADKIVNLLRFFQRIELDENIARNAGEFCRDLPKTLQVSDSIIAASCWSIDGTLVTLNRKHFEQIPGLLLYPL